MSNDQAPEDQAPQTTNEGAVAPTGESTHQQVEFGRSLPGQPPAGFPNGPDVDMYGNKRTVASADPALRTGDVNENPPGDPPTPEELAKLRRFLEEHGG